MACLLLPLMIGCGGGDSARTAKIEGLEFDSITTDTTVRLVEDDAQSPTCHIRLSIQYAKGGKQADAINDSLLRSGLLVPDYLALSREHITMRHAVDSFVKRYIADYLKDMAPLYRQDKDHATSYNCEYIVSTTTRNGRDNMLSYVADTYSFAGGAHGFSQTLIRNFDASTGKRITLTDIFVPGFEQRLCDKIVERMCKKFDAEDIEGLREQVIFEGIDPYPTDNFVLGKDEITFIYVEDEIAPHAVGEISIAIPYSDLEDLLRHSN